MKRLILLILLFTPLLLAAQNESGDRGFIVKVGDKCPNFVLELPNGEKTSIKELRGNVIMLQFTASWCSVCRKEMPSSQGIPIC